MSTSTSTNTRQALVDALTVAPNWVTTETGRKDINHVWRVRHNAAVNAWHRRQIGATVETLHPEEDAILTLAHGILTWVERVGPDSASDGFAGPHVLLPLLSGFRDALNLECRRLSCGTLDAWAFSVAERLDWDLDSQGRA